MSLNKLDISKTTAVAGSLTSPQLRSPKPAAEDTSFLEEMENEFKNIQTRILLPQNAKDKRRAQYRITLNDINLEAIALAKDLKNEVNTMSSKKQLNKDSNHISQSAASLLVSERKKNQFTDIPLIPNKSSQNTIFVKAPRNRAPLIRNDTTYDKGLWTQFSRLMTCLFPNALILKFSEMRDPQVIQAWREKITLCSLFLMLMLILTFVTFLISDALCPVNYNSKILRSDLDKPDLDPENFVAHGQVYKYDEHYQSYGLSLVQVNKKDITFRIIADDALDECKAINVDVNSFCTQSNCVKQSLLTTPVASQIRYSWQAIKSSDKLFVYNGNVVSISAGAFYVNKYFKGLASKLSNSPGKDITLLFNQDSLQIQAIKCFTSSFRIGFVDTTTFGCFTRDLISSLALFVILVLVTFKFILAIGYNWLMSNKLGAIAVSQDKLVDIRGNVVDNLSNISTIKEKLTMGAAIDSIEIPPDLRLIYSILMVTCYSEDEEGLKTTLESIGDLEYPKRYKLIVVVCDGIVFGSKQKKSTPDIVLGLIKEDESLGRPEPKSYISIADGEKRHNKARIHCGQYITKLGNSSNIIVIVKCGTDVESMSNKPGNRGKRDSQIILMDFYRTVMFDAPMSPFQFELFNKIYKLTKTTADKYEIVLMMDADTKVMADSLSHMSAVVAKDPMIMGLCGETRIMNKSDNWVSAIQVFEYYIAHHLAKAFESCFGGVTCLPGCFCMYRIKAPREDGTWTPVLASPEIVTQYSENVVNTLHKKNLLLLGEDRFLSTLMLRTFPNRKMMFVPKAVCKTTVPNTFKVLLSQRRRWINSTVHNLFELLLVQELCGTFCFSMQFVVLMELLGTLSLPAAIVFTV
eukprot:NODE_813_length_3989_cov_0.548329.p1 type:complete len:861 gc:universal NODE_813_length_3989_cov_0.548329:517-3099(+)